MPDFKKMKEKDALSYVQNAYAKQKQKNTTRNSRYRAYRALYDNDQDVWWGGDYGMPTKPLSTRYSLTFNLIAPLVEKWASFIMADELNWAVPPKRPDIQGHQEAQKAEKILYKLHERSLSQRTLNEVAKDAALLGTGWAKTLHDKDKKQSLFVYVRPEFVYPEPYISVFSGQFRYVIYGYEMQVEDAREEWNDNSIGPTLLEGSKAKDKEKAEETCAIIEYWSDTNYILTVGNKVKENMGNEYNFNPFTNFPLLSKGGKIYGQTFVDWILEPNAYFNQLTSQNADVIRMNSNPPIKYKNAPTDYVAQIIKGSTGGVIPLPREGDVDYMTWAGQPEIVRYVMELTMSFIHDVSHMPKIAFGDVGGNINSSRVLAIQYDPVLKVIRQARDNFTIALTNLNEHLLRLAEKYEKNQEIVMTTLENSKRRWMLRGEGKEPEVVELKGKDINGHYDTKVIWPGVLPKDDAGAARLEIEKKNATLQSTWTTMENLGIVNPEDEMALMISELEDERLHPKEQATTLGAMSKAMQAMGSLPPPEGATPEAPTPPTPGGGLPGGIGGGGIVPGTPGPEAAPPTPEEMENMEAQTWQE